MIRSMNDGANERAGRTQAELDNEQLDAEMTDAQRKRWAEIEADEIAKAVLS